MASELLIVNLATRVVTLNFVLVKRNSFEKLQKTSFRFREKYRTLWKLFAGTGKYGDF
jgi:hypothetical protein